MNRIETLAKVVGLLICLVFMFLQENYSVVQFSLFGIILLSIGIPHGAIDQLISNPKIDRKGLRKFLVSYISLIGAYLALWYFIPVLALLAFLIMSAYHFGQSHFLTVPANPKFSSVLFLSRGGFFLSAILLGSWDTTILILSPIIDLAFLGQFRLPLLGLFLGATLLIQLISGPKFNKNHLLELFILGPILYFTPLLVGFIVYFGFWHALPSMMAEYRFLRSFKAYDSFKKFMIQLLPFSLISLLGIGLIVWLGLKNLNELELILVFFVLISLISFPHILYMDRFLKNQN